MTLSVKKFTFTKTTSTSTPVSQEVNVTDFTPKILILWGNGLTTEGTYTEHYSSHFGFSDGTTSRCQTSASQDNAAAGTTTSMVRNDAIISILSDTTQSTELSRAQITSFDSDGFTLSWGVQSDTTAMVIHGIAIGGSDITDVKVVNDTVGRNTAGSQTYTGAGFTPTFVMAMLGAETSTINNISNILYNFHVGAAKSATEVFSLTCRSEGAATTSDTDQSLGNNILAHTLDQASGAVISVAAFTAFTSDGCTLNWSNPTTSSANLLGFLYVRGGWWDVGTFNQRSGTGTQNVTLDTGIIPKGVFLTGINSAQVGSVTTNNYIGIGASDGTTEGCIWSGDTNNVADMIATRVNLTSKVFRQATPAATASSSTTNAECDMSDMTTPGQFTLDWTTASATLVHTGFIAVGISQVSQTNIHKYHLFQNALQTSIHKYNLLSNVLQSSIHKYNLLVNLLQTSIHKYNIFANAIQETIHKYNILQNILQSSINKYDLRMHVNAGTAEMVVHIPLFVYPFVWIEGNEWQQLADFMAQYPDVQFIITVNPDSGPGTSQNSDFVAGFDILKGQGNANHVKIIGYVFTDYGARAIQDIKDDIDTYNEFYPDYINGIMLDEMDSVTGNESYYSEITDHVHQYFQISWGNPGTAIAESYVAANAVDIFMISETEDYPTSQTISDYTFNGAYSPRKFAMTVHSTDTYNSTLITDFATKVRAIYVTSDVAPNPYDTLSTYLDELANQSIALLGSTHKYNILNNILHDSIHKYNIIQNILSENIHKYHLFQNALQTSIHKYDIIAYVLANSIQKYNILKNILSQTINKYHILNTIIEESVHKYNILNNVLQTSLHKYNIFQNIINTSIYKYNIFANIITTSIHKYNIESLEAVLAELISKYHIFENITAESIHKYNILENITASSVHKYHLLQNILSDSIHKYNIFQNIMTTNIHKYNIFQNILQTSIHKYNILQNILQTSIHKYHLFENTIAESIHKYDIEQLGAIIASLIAKYDIRNNVVETSVQKYYILNNVIQNTIHKYNFLNNALQTSIHKYNIIQNILSNSIHKYNIRQNIISLNIHKYNIRNSIIQTSTHVYDIITALFVTATNIHKYNIKSNVIGTSIHKYTINIFGKVVVSIFGAGKDIVNKTMSKIVQEKIEEDLS